MESQEIRRLGLSSAAFVGAKAAAFFVPLLISFLLDAKSYGEFEYGFAWASSLALAAGLGMASAVPYFLLKRNRPQYYDTFRLYMTCAGTLATASIALAYLLGSRSYRLFTFTATSALTLQGIIASYLKTRNAPGRASVVESGLYFVLLGAVLCTLALRLPLTISWLTASVFGWLVVLLLLSIQKADRRVRLRHHVRRFRKILGLSLPILVSSLGMALLAYSGRLLSGNLLSFSDVAAYSFFFRICAASILVHHLLTVLLFSKIYNAEPMELDRYLSNVLAGVGLSAVLIWAGGTFLLPRLSRYREFADAYPGVFWILAVQMLFWSGIALAEFIFYREKMARHLSMILILAIGAMIGSCCALRASGLLSLYRMCAVQLLVMAGVLFAELALLRGAGIRLVRMSIVAASGLACFLGSLAWMFNGGIR